jgi:hypothetical protein
MWWSPWTISRPWLPRGIRGSDEWHNLSWGVNVPPFGMFIVFRMRYARDEIHEHLNLWTRNEGWEGLYVIGCQICSEIYSDHPDQVWDKSSAGGAPEPGESAGASLGVEALPAGLRTPPADLSTPEEGS